MAKNKVTSTLSVITEAERLTMLVLQVTHRSPKALRFTYVSRLQNTAIEVLERLYCANQCKLSNDTPRDVEMRLRYQKIALEKLNLLDFLSRVGEEVKCITPEQNKAIAEQIQKTISALNR